MLDVPATEFFGLFSANRPYISRHSRQTASYFCPTGATRKLLGNTPEPPPSAADQGGEQKAAQRIKGRRLAASQLGTDERCHGEGEQNVLPRSRSPVKVV